MGINEQSLGNPVAEEFIGEKAAGDSKSVVFEDDLVWGVSALQARRDAVRDHQKQFAERRQRWIRNNKYFYRSVERLFRFIVEPGRRVLNVRCQTGFFLNAVDPVRGVGVELSREMTEIARQRHPQFEFVTADPEELSVDDIFDYIIFCDINDTVDLVAALRRLTNLCQSHTRLILYSYNHLWQPVNKIAEALRIKMPLPEQNWLSETDLKGLLGIADFEWLRTYRVVLFPKWIPLISEFINRLIARLPIINRLCMINVLVARPRLKAYDPQTVSVSVIIPCKNEKGNIEAAVRRIPEMGKHTEIIFCDDNSNDGTSDEVRRIQRKYPGKDIKLVAGPGICKAQNVWTGFNAASGDVLMILDADLAVMPEELPYFFSAIVDRKGEFINGSRMVYPMQKMAMKFANMVGNKLFGLLFSSLLNQPIKDTLCGTKVLWRSDWQRIRSILGSWGVVDRWGDYELLFAATKLHLKIVDLPVHYQERVYGASKMVRVFRNGLTMLRMCVAAFLKLKIEF
jgi:SAM-dependent methyltransferase